MGRISALTELTSLASDDYLVVLDSSANIAKKISVANAFGIPEASFTAAGESWTYASATTITVPTDATTKYGKGMIIKITQSTGGTKYGTITNVAATLLTISWRGGATLANEAITSPHYTALATPLGAGLILPAQIYNPYKFSATQSSNQTGVTASTWTTVTLGTENFDTNSNFASNTYTAPVAGYYFFSAEAQVNATTTGNGNGAGVRLYKNGSTVIASVSMYDNNISTDFERVATSGLVYLNAGDTVVMQALGYTVSGTVLFTGSIFTGFLVSET